LTALLALCGISAAAPAESWQPLFDGTSLAGWKVQSKPADQAKTYWRVEDGTILVDSLGDGDHDYVWLQSEREFGDFELRLKFQAYRDSPGNSGVQFRSRYDATAGWLDGPQVDIHPRGPWRSGLIYDETRGVQKWVSPSLAKVSDAKPEMAPANLVFRYSEDTPAWNDLLLTVRGTQVRVELNGLLIREWEGAGVLDDAIHRQRNVGLRGHLALQLHKGDRLKMRFKDISVRELPAAGRPNLLFILTEDQGAQLGFVGTPGVQTPHMDALARSGVYFNRAFVVYPVCSASKAAIYTGLHNHTNGILNNTLNLPKPASELTAAERNHVLFRTNRIQDSVPTWVERLQTAGYYQGVTSKLHVLPNEKFPYEEFIRKPNHAAVAGFIERARKAGKPWHLFYNLGQSHRPYPNSDKVRIRVDPAAVKLPGFLPETPVTRKDWAEYLAAIEETDGLLGEGLAALRESGEEAKTLVIFLGDHGPTFPHGKMTLYDLGLRTPLIIRGPGLPAGQRTDALTSTLDLAPTILDLLGLEPLPRSHGQSLKPVLTGAPAIAGRDFVFAEISHRGPLPNAGLQERSVCDGRWKLIYREKLTPPWRQVQADSKQWETWGNRSYADIVANKSQFPEPYRILTEMDPQSLGGSLLSLELYNLETDPDELNNLAAETRHRPELVHLHAALRRWVNETGDPAVQPAPL